MTHSLCADLYTTHIVPSQQSQCITTWIHLHKGGLGSTMYILHTDLNNSTVGNMYACYPALRTVPITTSCVRAEEQSTDVIYLYLEYRPWKADYLVYILYSVYVCYHAGQTRPGHNATISTNWKPGSHAYIYIYAEGYTERVYACTDIQHWIGMDISTYLSRNVLVLWCWCILHTS